MWNRLLNLLTPNKRLKCKDCKVKWHFTKEQFNFSRKHYNGPYCGKCGKKL